MPILIGPYFQAIDNLLHVKVTDKMTGEEYEKAKKKKRQELMKFVFKMFDVFNEDKITEAGLFKFMQDASIRRFDQPEDPTELLKLNETENDIFIDIFSTTQVKIIEALAKKSRKPQ